MALSRLATQRAQTLHTAGIPHLRHRRPPKLKCAGGARQAARPVGRSGPEPRPSPTREPGGPSPHRRVLERGEGARAQREGRIFSFPAVFFNFLNKGFAFIIIVHAHYKNFRLTLKSTKKKIFRWSGRQHPQKCRWRHLLMHVLREKTR